MASSSTSTTTSPLLTPKNNHLSSAVQVAVRVRPILSFENGSHKCISVHSNSSNSISNIIEIGAGGSKMGGNSKKFLFDACFTPKASQREVFSHSVQPLIDACLDGYNATVLAYGQTGSGKTHTILGPSAEVGFEDAAESTPTLNNDISSTSSSNRGGQAGIIPRSLRDLFHKLESTKKISIQKQKQQQDQSPYEYEVRVQFLELYGEEIRDLLSSSPSSSSSNKLVIRDGVGQNNEPDVVGAVEVKVNSAADALLCLTRGMLRRVTGATAMNAESSRSHAIMTVIVEQTTLMGSQLSDDNDSNDSDSDSKNKSSNNSRCRESNEDFESKRSKFHFVDLAGSERQKRSKAQGIRLKEGIDINKGLLVLGNVISALGDLKKKGKSFVPYRDSKLTRLLKGSLGGNHKTLMIACVSPSSLNMEESLNCLRYANRAKNIQNNAVINVDAGSKLVGELRGQVQALATELLSAQQDNIDGEKERRFSNEMLKKMASSDDTSKLNVGSDPSRANGTMKHADKMSPSKLSGREGRQENARNAFLEVSKAEISILKQTIKELQSELASKAEELFAAKAEVQYYRMQMNPTEMNEKEKNSDLEKESDDKDAPKSIFLHQVTQYERDIAKLKTELREAKANASSTIDVDDENDTQTTWSNISPEKESPSEKNNLHSPKSSKVLKKKRQEQRAAAALDRESKEEEKEIERIAKKYIKLGNTNIDDEDEDNSLSYDSDTETEVEELFLNRQAHLDAHVMELAKGISAKEELIDQLKQSQTKYDTMKVFYQDKLRKMTMQLRDHVAEKNNLEMELKKYERDSQKYKDLLIALKAKEKHIEHLRNRQAEIKSLTSIASRNHSVVEKLKTEIAQMKQQKITLHKQLSRERKEHEKSVQQLKKRALTHERSAKKAKQDLASTMAQKDRVQQIAKSRAEQVSKLRSKYREAEKRLRMQTLKRGVMEKAGIDPVMVGRTVKDTNIKQSRRSRVRSQSSSQVDPSRKKAYLPADIHQMQTLLDEKVAEISRKEATADKLAIEWEDHLELTSRKEEIMNDSRNSIDQFINDELEALDFQIQYKESRIRQLARRLSSKPGSIVGNNESSCFPQDILIDDQKFKEMTRDMSAISSAQLASKVLFGMVVKERRRVAKLARTASSLDRKVLDAENHALAKESALRSHMEESKNERVATAQNHQEKILSLMSLLHQDEMGQEQVGDARSPDKRESVILALANERIDSLEKQLEELKSENQSLQKYQERESETVAELTHLTNDYRQMLEKSKELRLSLHNVREKVTSPESDLGWPESKDRLGIVNLIDKVLSQGKSSRVNQQNDEKKPSSLINKKRAKPASAYYNESEDEDEEEATDSPVPEWAGHIMEDLAIIAAGEVPPSLRKTKSHRPPIQKNDNVFDRLSNPDNFTGTTQKSHLDRSGDDGSVGSIYSNRSTSRKDASSFVRKDAASLIMRANANNQKTTNLKSIPFRSRSRSNTPVRISKGTTPTPFRHSSPGSIPGNIKSSALKSRFTDRITEVLKEGGRNSPPKFLSIPKEDSNDVIGSRERGFMNAYTQKDVFERLQKKVTNSYALSQKAIDEE